MLASRGPISTVVFFCEVKKGSSNSRVVRYESTIEVAKAKKGMYFFDFGGGQSGGDAIEFDRVHSKLSWFHNHSEVLNFENIELTLLQL